MRNYYKAFIVLIFITFIYESTIAQEEEDVKSVNSNRKYKKEAGIDIGSLGILLGSGNGGYPSVFFRKHFTKSKDSKNVIGVKNKTFHAYRFRIGSNLSFKNIEFPDITQLNLTNPYGYYYQYVDLENRSSFFVRLGRERQERIGKFELFYGYDLFFYNETYKRYDADVAYNYIYDPIESVYYNLNHQWKYKDTNTSFGLSPIFGFKYFLIPRLCFSAEAKADIGYSVQTKSEENNWYNTFTKEKQSKILVSSKKGLDMRISPLYLINMGYYF